MALENINIKGAREHNLKNLHLTLPREKLVVITGLSGSGKSSLAFDTLYAEGQLPCYPSWPQPRWASLALGWPSAPEL